MVRGNVTYLFMLIAAGIIFGLFACPILDAHGESWVCLFFYGFLVLAFIYGRSMRPPVRRPKVRTR